MTFIERNKDLTHRVLEYLQIEDGDFETSMKYFNEHMGSIADLRSLWLERNNQFAKAYRILSKEYLRKHSLEYTFNSRVTTVCKHLKYRNKI